MMTPKVQKAMNQQVNMEAYSAYIYLSISAYFAKTNLEGFAHWMRLQAEEELQHAMKLFDHILERDGDAQLMAVKAPPSDWKTPLAAVTAALKHEKKNTALINALVGLAKSEKDHATDNFLQWYVQEQVEEEAQAQALVDKVKLIGNSGGALFILDQELAKRQLPPAA